MFFHEIETERLWLRNLAWEDRAFLLRQFSDDAVNRYLYDAEPLRTLEEADELIAFYLQPEPRAQHRWVIVWKADGAKIGTCGFHAWNREQRRADIGYDLQKAFWGRGVMTEAVRAILSFAAREMGVRQIHAHISVENERSIRLARRMGFAPSGRTQRYVFRGKEYPHEIYTLDCPGT